MSKEVDKLGTPALRLNFKCSLEDPEELADKFFENPVQFFEFLGDEKSDQEIEKEKKLCLRREIPEDIAAKLVDWCTWDFYIFDLEKYTNGHATNWVARQICDEFAVGDVLKCPEVVLCNWIYLIESWYRPHVPYHNATHGGDVMQGCAYLLRRRPFDTSLSKFNQVAVILSALVHDLDHPGRTNPFLVNSRHPLALLYNDVSPCENHHISLALRLTTGLLSYQLDLRTTTSKQQVDKADDANIFMNLSNSEFKAMRSMMIDLVLATDISKHMEHLNHFRHLMGITKESARAWAEIDPYEKVVENLLNRSEDLVQLSIDATKSVMRIILKVSDISNPIRPGKIAQIWASRIADEYMQQTEDEDCRGIPNQLRDFKRGQLNLPHTQIGFIDYLVRDLVESLHRFAHVPHFLDNLYQNRANWLMMAEIIIQKRKKHK